MYAAPMCGRTVILWRITESFPKMPLSVPISATINPTPFRENDREVGPAQTILRLNYPSRVIGHLWSSILSSLPWALLESLFFSFKDHLGVCAAQIHRHYQVLVVDLNTAAITVIKLSCSSLLFYTVV